MRRSWAAIFDYVFISAIYIFMLGVKQIPDHEFTGYSIYWEVYCWSLFCIVSLVQVLVTKGSTLGHAACRMILVSEDGGIASAWQLIKRYLYLLLFTELPLIIADRLMGRRFAFIIDIMIPGLVFISRIYFIDVVLRKGKSMPHDKICGTLYMATDTPK